MYIPGLDEQDNNIISLLRENARLGFSDIAAKIGMSRVAVKNRIDDLEKRGIIQGYQAIVSEESIPNSILFFLDVEALPEMYSQVVAELNAKRILRKIYATTGECRIHAIGLAPNQATLDSFVNHLFRATKGIRKIGCHTALSTIKDVDRGVDYEREINKSDP